jgi:hypothetical protein
MGVSVLNSYSDTCSFATEINNREARPGHVGKIPIRNDCGPLSLELIRQRYRMFEADGQLVPLRLFTKETSRWQARVPSSYLG